MLNEDLNTMNAKEWALEFMKNKERIPNYVTESTLVGWFHRAFSVGYTEGRKDEQTRKVYESTLEAK